MLSHSGITEREMASPDSLSVPARVRGRVCMGIQLCLKTGSKPHFSLTPLYSAQSVFKGSTWGRTDQSQTSSVQRLEAAELTDNFHF